MDAALKAIAEPRRRQILRLVWNRELSAGDIAAQFEVTPSAVSQHLKVLREADLVTERRDGTHRFYLARRDTMADLRKMLEHFWDDSLDALKRAAEREERRKR